jgi:hypothetical protein
MCSQKLPEEIPHSQLLAVIDKIKTPLSAMALLGLVNEFYSSNERQMLYAKYEALRNADHDAYETLAASIPIVEPGLGWEARVRKYGEDAATEHLASNLAALNARKETSRAVTSFENEHPLIVRLLKIKDQVGKRPHEK